jgi:cytochrome c5
LPAHFYPPGAVRAATREPEDLYVKKSMWKKTVGLVAVLGLAAMSLSSFALTDKQLQDVKTRIKPVGSVCLEGDSSCGGAVAESNGKPKTGEEVYNTSCMACHSTGVGGAPKSGDKAAWKPRIAQGADTLHTHAITGIRAMPPKGTCAACSDDEVKAAVDYMIAHSK